MIKTIKINPHFLAEVGQPQIQPAVDDAAYATGETSNNQTKQLPFQNPIAVNAIQRSSTGFNKPSNVTLEALFNDPQALKLPATQTNFNTIVPNYSPKMEVSSFIVDHFPDEISGKKFEPYEQLTGISQERPEIVMLMDFLPLFVKEVGFSQQFIIKPTSNGGINSLMTDAGKFFETQVNLRNLLRVNANNMVTSLKSNHAALASQLNDKRQQFENAMVSLNEMALFLLLLIKNLDQMKEQLDLRNNRHVVNPHVVIQNYALNCGAPNGSVVAAGLLSYAARYMLSSFDIKDTLVSLGFKNDNILKIYASTKIWLQTLIETRDIIKHHSMEFVDRDPVPQRNDNNAISIVQNNTRPFSLKVHIANLPVLDTLINLQPSQIPSAIINIHQAFLSIYENIHFQSQEARIAGLANLISKEFRYSFGVSQPFVQRTLADHYGYNTVENGNVSLFDAVFGAFGNNIDDIPVAESNSLVNIAQHRADKEGVLTFESKYIVGDTGTITPGASYYVDHVLKNDGQQFNTDRLEQLSDKLESANRQFSAIVYGMNLLANRIIENDNLEVFTGFNSFLSNPIDFIDEMLKIVVDKSTGTIKPYIVNDKLGSIYTQAFKDTRIKSILFIYHMNKIARAYNPNIPFFNSSLEFDNTPGADALIEQLLSDLLRSVLETSGGATSRRVLSGFKGKDSPTTFLDPGTIRSSIKSGTPLSRMIESVLGQVFSAFKINDMAMFNGRTRFSGHVDTSVMMAVFDMLILIISKYNGQNIVSTSSSVDGVMSYVINRTNSNMSNSIRDLTTRAEHEVALNQKLIYTIMSVLQNTSNVAKSQVNFLESMVALDKISRLTTIIGNPELMPLLISEQQVMLLASTIYDVQSILASGKTLHDSEYDGANPEFKLLDESVITSEMKEAIYGLFGTPEYASQKGFNKKILTVGIPAGFTWRLQQQINLSAIGKSAFINKQKDIVNIVVYKTDLEHPDVVYKPRRYMFELSRFPVRSQIDYLVIPENPTLDDLVNAIPTRDFGQSLAAGYDPVYGNLTNDARSQGTYEAFSDSSYFFLSDREKSEILRNHVISYLTELYIKVMTGLSVADHSFDLVSSLSLSAESDLVKTMLQLRVNQLFDQSQQSLGSSEENVLFSTTFSKRQGVNPDGRGEKQQQMSNLTGIAGNVSDESQFSAFTSKATPDAPGENNTNFSDVLSRLSARQVPGVVHDLRVLNNVVSSYTPIADSNLVSRRMLQPKQFDRVFNIVVDPDDFEIDYNETVKTPQGKQTLEQLIANGDVISTTEDYLYAHKIGSERDLSGPTGRNRLSAPNNVFKFRDRDINEGDITFEKYFVTVETYDANIAPPPRTPTIPVPIPPPPPYTVVLPPLAPPIVEPQTPRPTNPTTPQTPPIVLPPSTGRPGGPPIVIINPNPDI